MSLKKLLKEEREYKQFPNSFRQRPFFEINSNKVEKPTLDCMEEFYLVATVAVTYRTYESNHREVRELAERTLIHRLYSEILSEIPRLELAITSGNGDEAMECVSRMKDFIYGDD